MCRDVNESNGAKHPLGSSLTSFKFSELEVDEIFFNIILQKKKKLNTASEHIREFVHKYVRG